MEHLGILGELVVVFGGAVAVVALLRRIGLPSIAGFLVAGMLVGPSGLGLIHDPHDVELLAEIGVVLLLFEIGMELSFSRLRRMWRPILVGGSVQLLVTIGAGALLAWWLGQPWPAAVVVGFVVGVSSTAIVLRGLSARGELEAPHGRLALGILIFQDLAVVPMMLVIPLLARGAVGLGEGLWAVGRAVLVLIAVVGVGRLVVPRVLHQVARTGQRDLFVLTVSVACLGTAWIAASAGISLALGAFLGGLVVADSEYRHQAMAEVIPFREVLTSLFFVSVGMLLDLGVPMEVYGRWLGLLAVVLVGKALLVALAALILRLPVRVAVLTGAALAQVGEFSFVMLRAAEDLLPAALARDLYAVAILSMLVTPLLLLLGPRLAAGVSRLRLLTRLLDVRPVDTLEAQPTLRDHVVIAGYGITGIELARALAEQEVAHVVLDLDADRVRRASARGEPVYFGDVTSPEVLESVHLASAQALVIGINDPEAAERATSVARRVAPEVPIVVRARFVEDCEGLRRAGATEVIPAEVEAAAQVTSRLLLLHGVDRAAAEEREDAIRARWTTPGAAGGE